ncbi:hypothetical protein HW115_01820 [Verrucomicrobiaceae bacterium N1E253]|uniref:Lipoprotein n=1 Tax=Oceaniferula marina TaxID=2748318 RepID=A0A851GF17_9BACT|nr:hypothetical protein [Oceaniferula marina]NWK54331.1 hypothetical protein [Oceaniferula marina]
MSDYRIIRTLAMAALLMLTSCESERTMTQKKVNKDPWGNELPFSVGKDEHGNPMMQSDKRSSFENKSSQIAANKDFSGKDYTSKSYRKKRWAGDKSYQAKQFNARGDTSKYKHEPWYVRKQSGEQSVQAADSKKKFSINPFRSKRATEQTARRTSTTENVQVSKRRQSYKQPDVTDWKDQRGLTIQDTNGMLGR